MIDTNSPEINTMIADLIRQHLPEPWHHTWDNAKKRAGSCNYTRTTISISAPIHELATVDDLTQTVLHEIAHVLTGAAAGHGAQWRAAVSRIGGSADRCHTLETPPAPWVGTCPSGHTVERHRRPRSGGMCLLCYRAGHPVPLFAWSHNGRPVGSQRPQLDANAAAESAQSLAVGDRVELRNVSPAELNGLTGAVSAVRRTRCSILLDEASSMRIRGARSKAATAVAAQPTPEIYGVPIACLIPR